MQCKREEHECSRRHRVVLEYNRDPASDHWDAVYSDCHPGQTSLQCGPHTFHHGTVYTAADMQSWTRITVPLPNTVFSRFRARERFLLINYSTRISARGPLLRHTSHVAWTASLRVRTLGTRLSRAKQMNQ